MKSIIGRISGRDNFSSSFFHFSGGLSASVFNTPSVEPVIVGWSVLLESSGFSEIGPFWWGAFAGFFQESGESGDEVGLVDVFDTDHFGCFFKVFLQSVSVSST